MSKKGSKLKQFLINRDLFGHPISLNFNNKGDSHRTAIGGVLSIFLRILYYSYMGYLLHKMLHYEDDRTYSFDFQIPDKDQLDEHNFSESGVI